MDDRVFELPEAAQRLIRVIEGTLDEAASVDDGTQSSESAYTLRETRARYLPETIAAYLAIPPSQREVKDETGMSAFDAMMAQLSILDRSTKRERDALAAGKRSELAANASFLAERLNDRSTEISSVEEVPAYASAVPSLGRWITDDVASDATQVVAVVAKRLREHFPTMTKVRNGGAFGMGRIESVTLTLPQGAGVAFRYTLSAIDGALEPSVSKLVHGTTIKTVSCSANEWIASLYQDITEQARHHAELRAPLIRLFQTGL